jgi:hypothetical protein
MKDIPDLANEHSTTDTIADNTDLPPSPPAEDDFLTPFHTHGYFGAYPTSQDLCTLERLQFDYIVKLTLEPEKNVDPYETTIPIIHLPIKDNSVPVDWERFSLEIVHLVQLLRDRKRLFIHCKGGHGRSCLVVACILYYTQTVLNSRDAIEETIRIHNQRTNMSVRWKGIKSPFSKTQYIFLYKFLNPICILKSYNTGYQAGFSGSSLFQIEHELGSFSNVDAAYQAARSQPCFTNPFDEMLKLIWIKFRTYPELQENLLHTGIRRIYDHSRYAFGDNLIGRCLMEIRHVLMLEQLIQLNETAQNTPLDDGLNSSCE